MIDVDYRPSTFEPHTEDDYLRLLEQYTEVSALVGSLAHEIKNPLSTIRLNMELMAEDFHDAETPRERRAKQKIEVMQRECVRLQNLLDDFLNYSRLRNMNLQPANLNDLLVRVLDFFEPKALECGIEVLRFLDPDLPSVLIDQETMHAALLNLVLNAQQAMPEGGQLVVRSRGTKSGVALDLIDTGCGMDGRILSQAFTTFFSTKPGGSGLGLPTTRRIIEAHQGVINVQSEVGRGTQFTIELPTPKRIS
ncbi:MAG: ATP-binding protein [Pirellulales bacterium]